MIKNLRYLCTLLLLAVASVAWGDTKTDVIDNSVTSSILGETSTSSWHDVFSITGTSGAKYSIRSMGTKETTNALQWNANGYLYMTETPSGYKLKSVKVTTTANKNIGVYAQSTAYTVAPSGTALSTLAATSNGATYTFTSDYTYLALKGTASSTSITSIEIVWEESGGTITPTYTVTYDANGGTGTMTDENSPYEENDEVTLLGNTFTAPADMIWDSWEVKDADDNNITVTNGKFTMPASNVTVKAQWVADPNAPQYEWVETDLANLTSTDIFVIVGTNSGTYAMTNNNGSSVAPAVSSVTISDGKIISTVTDNIKWNVSGSTTDGYTFYPNGSTTTWLYCNTTAESSSNNNMRVGTGNRKLFVLNNNNLVTKDDYVARYVSVYLSNSVAQDWRGYVSPSTTVKFYKRQVVSSDPSIFADNVNIAYDATEGNISFTINNEPTPAGSMSAAVVSGSTIANLAFGTISSTTVPFTCDANTEGTTRTATITLTYTYGDNETVTKDVTITQAAVPVVYTTIPSLFAAAISTAKEVAVKFDNWVISGVNGNQFFVTDGTNGFIGYQTGHGFEVGNTLSGTVSCNLVLYNGSAEITGLTSESEGLIVGTGASVTPVSTTIDALNAVNTGSVVTLSNLTCSVTISTSNGKTYTNYDLSDGTNTIRAYTSLYDFTETPVLENGKTYNVTGVFVLNNSNKRILPRSSNDIEEVEVTTPIIKVTNTSIELVYNAISGEIPYEIENPIEGIGLTAVLKESVDWISNIAIAFDRVTFTTTANEGDADRTAIITLTYGDVTKDVTVTQSHFVVDYATLPFEFDGGKGDIENTVGLTQNGLGSDYSSAPKLKFDETGDYVILKFNERPGKLTFDIKGNVFSGGTFTVQTSEDGETYTDLETYTTLGNTQSEEFKNLGENVRYIKWIYTEKSSGNVALGNITLAQYVAPELYTLAIANPENVTITATYGDAIINNGGNATVANGTEITLALTIPEDYALETLTVKGEEEGQTVTPKESTTTEGVYTFNMPSYNVTVNATVVQVETTTYTLATSITPGKHYIIANGTNGKVKAMGEQTSNNRAAVEIEVNDGTATVFSNAGAYEFVIDRDAENRYTIYDESEESTGYLYAASSNANNLKTQAENNVNGLWKITIGEGGVASIVASESSNRNVMQYNNDSSLFSCYASASQSPVYLFKETKLGDVNGDNTVDIADVTKLVNIIVSGAEPNTEQIAAGNLNPDEGLTVNDVEALVQMILSNSNQ